MTITARIDIDPAPALVLHGDGTAPAAAELVGRRARVAATPQDAGEGQWSVELPLAAARWGSQPLPLPSGAYEVRLTDADDQRGVEAGKLAAQILETFGGKGPLPRRSVGQRPVVRLDNIQRQNRTHARRKRQGGVVMRTQIAFEPDENIHGTCI